MSSGLPRQEYEDCCELSRLREIIRNQAEKLKTAEEKGAREAFRAIIDGDGFQAVQLRILALMVKKESSEENILDECVKWWRERVAKR